MCAHRSRLPRRSRRAKKCIRLWSSEEIATAVYFSSRYICSISVSYMMHRRGYRRTPSAIEKKVQRIIDNAPSLRPSQLQWDVDAVDHWLDDLLEGPEAVRRHIKFSSQDAEIVALSIDDTLDKFKYLEHRWHTPMGSHFSFTFHKENYEPKNWAEVYDSESFIGR
ncbi:hypothetical protein BDV36DRAFT_245522 [Aspergillus pseudocaelatus]|uniref:Uncharacterized protein n=1 Tax=Aspergillus pseudocaelatus TaxID=1825620 RepID=A0ABQ6WZ22_9EURO|nr:hypothetical protein BDV36DRAFT_245522 [Aspergillus pseudocaelatus]